MKGQSELDGEEESLKIIISDQKERTARKLQKGLSKSWQASRHQESLLP